MNLKNITVIGAGQMGAGIAQVVAMAGFESHLYDENQEACDKALSKIRMSLEKLASKGKISEEVEQVMSRLHRVDALEDISKTQSQLVIEAIIEDLDIKKSLFSKLDKFMDADCVFASNTSSISIGRLAESTTRPDKFIGMHFMNPVPIMKLVEIIRSEKSSDETYELVQSIAQKMNKTTVVSRDVAGFIVNRVLMPMINEACVALQEELASAEDIDQAMVLGTNQPMGPLALADYIGLDTCQYIMEVIYADIQDPKFLPAEILKEKVKKGLFGRKSGQGFYQYS